MSFGYEPKNVRARFDCISSWGANVKPAVVIAGNLFAGLAYIENGSENSVQNEERERKNSLVPKERPPLVQEPFFRNERAPIFPLSMFG
jgi:hypothetical protein